MASRAGWTFDGKHFAETITARMGLRRAMYFIDGKPATYAEWLAALRVARAAEENRKAVEEILKETGAA